MKNIFITLIFVTLAHISFATHYLSSDISYTHISGLTYGITIRIYNNTLNTTADRCEILVRFGDGDSLSVPRTNGISSQCPSAHDGIMIATNVKESIYSTTHTYASGGIYIISFEDVNRTPGICNIPNSVNIGIYMQAEIVINPILGDNTAPQYASVPLNYAATGVVNYYNPSAIDSEGDSLFYQIVNPMAYGQSIIGYSIPLASNSFSIDSITGTVTWDKPLMICDYSYDIKITEWRKLGGVRYYIGSTMQDVYNRVSASAGILNLTTDENFSVYPNPAQSEIIVSVFSEKNKCISIEIKNILGQTIKTITDRSFENGNNEIKIDLSNYPKGIYFVQLENGNKRYTNRFMKQ